MEVLLNGAFRIRSAAYAGSDLATIEAAAGYLERGANALDKADPLVRMGCACRGGSPARYSHPCQEMDLGILMTLNRFSDGHRSRRLFPNAVGNE